VLVHAENAVAATAATLSYGKFFPPVAWISYATQLSFHQTTRPLVQHESPAGWNDGAAGALVVRQNARASALAKRTIAAIHARMHEA
jgi:hypothetical protein